MTHIKLPAHVQMMFAELLGYHYRPSRIKGISKKEYKLAKRAHEDMEDVKTAQQILEKLRAKGIKANAVHINGNRIQIKSCQPAEKEKGSDAAAPTPE